MEITAACNTSTGICTCDQQTGNCTCRKGWTGQTCDEDVNECLSNPCGDIADCHNTPGSFDCVCPLGYLGTTDIGCEGWSVEMASLRIRQIKKTEMISSV